MLFLSVRGFSDYAGPTVHSRLAWLPCCLPPTRNEVGILIYGLFAAQSPRPPMPLSTLRETPRDVPRKTRGQDGFATSFPVGLLHPLQHAGLARRTPVCPTLGRSLNDRQRQTSQMPTSGQHQHNFRLARHPGAAVIDIFRTRLTDTNLVGNTRRIRAKCHFGL